MKKKIISLLLLTVMITTQLISCGRNNVISNESTTGYGTTSSNQTVNGTSGGVQDPLVDSVASGIIVPADDTDPAEKMIQAYVATGVMIYGDTIYYNYLPQNSNAEIRYQNLNNIQDEGSELGADPLASSSSGGLFDGIDSWPFFLIDECATEENNGIPVFIIACEYPAGSATETVHKIFSYNTKDNTMKVIHEETENIQWLSLYGDYIFYITNEGDKGWIIHRIGKDGSNHIEMENKEALSNSIHFIYKDKIYYTQGNKKLLSMNLDFSESEYLFDVITNASPFINDGYIYYMSNLTRLKEGGKYVNELCRRNIDDISKEETVLSNIAIGMHRNGIFYYFKYDSVDDTVYNDNIIYGYAVQTGESFVAIEKHSIESGLIYLGWNEEYLVCRFSENGELYLMIVNIETGKENVIPYR